MQAFSEQLSHVNLDLGADLIIFILSGVSVYLANYAYGKAVDMMWADPDVVNCCWGKIMMYLGMASHSIQANVLMPAFMYSRNPKLRKALWQNLIVDSFW